MKTSKIFASAVLGVATLLVPISTVHAYYYPVNRQTYTCQPALPDGSVPCPGADHVQFDSFTNNPVVGDERPFVAGTLNGQGNVQDRLQVKDGDTVVIRAYVHNNADAAKMGGEANTVAKNVKIYFLIPTATQSDSTITGAIDADNANPKEVNDTMSVYANTPFTLEYVKGSAVFSHSVTGNVKDQKDYPLSDSIVTPQGASLGDILGCFNYSGYVYLTVKVHMQTTPPPAQIQVCNLSTKQIVTINESDFDSSKYTKDLTQCAQTPPPTQLPNTGAGDTIGIVAGAIVAGTIAGRLYLSRKLARKA